MSDSLGDRIKNYESSFNQKLPANSPVIIRVDGKAFHTFTRGFEKPFDSTLISAMIYATKRTAQNMDGFKLAYTQSDEASFMITDYDTVNTNGWFGYSLNKIVSVTASLFTGHFNDYLSNYPDKTDSIAFFDARAFIVPRDDWQNVFIWRQRDWERNSLQMLARAHFSHKQLHKKNSSDIHDMLHSVGVNWANLSPHLKNGTFYLGDAGYFTERVDYATLTELVGEITKKD